MLFGSNRQTEQSPNKALHADRRPVGFVVEAVEKAPGKQEILIKASVVEVLTSPVERNT